MPVSAKEIEELLGEAQACIKSWHAAPGENSLGYILKANECCARLIQDATTPKLEHYEARAEVMLVLHSWHWQVLRDEELEGINNAIQFNPDEARNYRKRAFYYVGLQEQASGEGLKKTLLQKAINDCRAGLERNPSDSGCWLVLMAASILLHDWDDAISHYGQCKPFVTDPEDRVIRAWLGCVAIALTGETVDEEDRSDLIGTITPVRMCPYMMSTASFLGENYRRDKGNEKWRKAVELSTFLVPHLREWLDRGNMLKRLACFEEALQAFNNVLEKNLNCTEGLYGKANVLVELRRFDEALRAYASIEPIKSIADPDSIDDMSWWLGFQHRVDVLMEMKRPGDALHACERGMDLLCQFNYPRAVFALAHHTIRLVEDNFPEDAFNAYERVIELLCQCNHPEYAAAFATGVMYFLAPGDALKLCERGMELLCQFNCSPCAVYFVDNTVKHLVEANLAGDAIKACERAIELFRQLNYHVCVQYVSDITRKRIPAT